MWQTIKRMAQQIEKFLEIHSASSDGDDVTGFVRAIEKYSIEFLRMDTSRPLAIGKSKIGGRPHLPRGFQWPYYEGVNYHNMRTSRPLSFIAQINLSEITAMDEEHKLPDSGFLYFFYELDTMMWGLTPEEKGCARVFYYEISAKELSVTNYPWDLRPNYYVPESPIKFRKRRSIPSFEEIGNRTQLASAEYLQAAQKCGFDTDRSPESVFKLLGYADLIQGSVVRECTLIEAGYSVDKWKFLSDNKKNELSVNEDRWILLAQFGTISESIMFGDYGCIYFYIKEDDLRKRQFNDVHLSLQCY